MSDNDEIWDEFFDLADEPEYECGPYAEEEDNEDGLDILYPGKATSEAEREAAATEDERREEYRRRG